MGADGTRVTDTLIWFHEASLSTVDACEPVQKKKKKDFFLKCVRNLHTFSNQRLQYGQKTKQGGSVKVRLPTVTVSFSHDSEF